MSSSEYKKYSEKGFLNAVLNAFMFIKQMPRNFKIMMTRSSLANFVNNMNSYNSPYAVALGAHGAELGAIRAISSLLGGLVGLFAGWISDKENRKKIIIIGSILGLLAPLLYSVAPFWTWLIPAAMLSGLGNGVFQPAWNSLYADSVKSRARGKSYGIANTLIFLPTLFANIIAGHIIESFGGLTAEGIRPLYMLQLVILASTLAFILKFLRDNGTRHRSDDKASVRKILSDYKDVLAVKGVKGWTLMKGIGAFSIGLASPFWILYAATVLNASAITIAYMLTCRQLVRLLTSPLMGWITDRIGRKNSIFLGRSLMYIAIAIFLLSSEPWQMIIAYGIWGIKDAGMLAWSAVVAEIVPVSYRSKMSALDTSSLRLFGVPGSLLGGLLWDINPITPLIFMVIIDSIIRMPMIHFLVPEPRSEEKSIPRLQSDK
jgi:MFS family permease